MSSGLIWFVLVVHLAFALLSILPTLFDSNALEAQNMKSSCYQDVSRGEGDNSFTSKVVLDAYTVDADNAAWLESYDMTPYHYVTVASTTLYRRSGGSWVTTSEGERVKRWANVPTWFCATPLAAFLDALSTLKGAISWNPIDILTKTIGGAAKMVKALVFDMGSFNYAILRHDGDILGAVSIMIRVGLPLLIVGTTASMWLKKG